MSRARLLVIFVAALLAGCASQSKEEGAKSAQRAEIHTELAKNYLARNQLEIALRELDKALAVDPDNSQANNIMALAQTRLQHYDKADGHFRKAVSADPDNSDAQNAYGVFLCQQGRWDEAEARFRKAAANPLYRDRALANHNAGQCLLKKPAPAAAAGYFRAALGINPQYAPSLYQMAKISLDAGQPLSARGYIQRFMEVSKDSPEALWLAIRIERALNNKDLQASYALRLRAKFPESAEAKQLNQRAR